MIPVALPGRCTTGVLASAVLILFAAIPPAFGQVPPQPDYFPSPTPPQLSPEPIQTPANLGAAGHGNAILVRDIPARTAEELDEFVEGVSSNDALFRVFVGQGRLLTLKQDLVAPGRPEPLIAIGDPTVIDFEVVGNREIRVTGQRIGVTDLSIFTADGSHYGFEVAVTADLELLRVQLQAAFPSASLQLRQIREHVIVEGQARDSRQVAQIIETIRAYLLSVQVSHSSESKEQAGLGPPGAAGRNAPLSPVVPATDAPGDGDDPAAGEAAPTSQPVVVFPGSGRPDIEAELPPPQIINLIRVPGAQQVMLKVQIAELNRTALREIGVSFLFQDGANAVGSQIARPFPPSGGGGGGANLLGLLDPVAAGSTLFAVFDAGSVNFLIQALRRNQVLKILAEPTLVALNGQEANFLAGGEFPVPVPQGGSALGTVTIQFKEFGVGLNFVPHILDDDVIRLAVAPEVSSIDFSLGIALQGTQVPALSTRRTRTVVELREGQTLAISGLLQTQINGTTNRIPGLGDVPYLGTAFSSNSSQTQETELIVLVTPYLVEGIDDGAAVLPGECVMEPDDLEFYLKGRIEKRSCRPYRATAAWDDPFEIEHRRAIEASHVSGPYGYSP
ncbi:MAG: pilus assembly protein N-terminal domain-containing protein [Planctomycetaceae bacterium]